MSQIEVLYQNSMDLASTDSFPAEYLVKIREFCELFDEIKKCLPDDKIRLLMDFETVHGALISIHEEMGYRFGFSDAFKLSAEALSKTA